MALTTNSEYFPVHQLNGIYNQGAVCLLRGTNLIFKCNSGYYAPYSSSSTRCCYKNDKRAKPGKLKKAVPFSAVGEYSVEKDLNAFRL
jgi:hypothetical protein